MTDLLYLLAVLTGAVALGVVMDAVEQRRHRARGHSDYLRPWADRNPGDLDAND